MITLIENNKLSLQTDNPIISKTDVPHIQSLSAAGSKMRAMVDGLGTQIKQSERNGYAKGFETGRLKGHEKAKAEVSQLMLFLTRQAAVEKRALQSNVALLSMQVVRKIAAALGPEETVAALVETAARQLLGGEELSIFVHPTALEAVQQRMHILKRETGDSNSWISVYSDNNLSPFDCLLKTGFGTTVAGLDQQLSCLEKALMQPLDSDSQPAIHSAA